MYDYLGMDEILKRSGLRLREREYALISILGRLTGMISEHQSQLWLEKYAFFDILDIKCKQICKDSFYRIMDKLIEKKEKIEGLLWEREANLFNLDSTIFLYDLTNTYFEGRVANNKKAQYGGDSKEKRDDCKQICVGVVLHDDGAIRKHIVYEGNKSEGKTIIDVIMELKEPQDKQPTVIMDRGMASEGNIKLLREAGINYIVVHRGKEVNNACIKGLKEEEFNEVVVKSGNKIAIHLTRCEEEVYLICKSPARAKKEEAIRTRAQKKIEESLEKLAKRIKAGRLKEEEKIYYAIGRLKERYSLVSRYYRVGYDKGQRELTIEYLRDKINQREENEGMYILRTNRVDLSDEEIFRLYLTLNRIERAFKDLKSDLNLRPIFHQKEERVDAHIFITILAYHILYIIEKRLQSKDDYRSWSTVREILSTHVYSTTILPTKSGRIINIRKPGIPEGRHKAIYEALDIKYYNLPIKKIYI